MSDQALAAALVSDRPDWVESARSVCIRAHVIAERESWSSVKTRAERVAAMVLDVSSPFEIRRPQLAEWAHMGRQPLSILCITPDRGAADLSMWLQRLGYRHLVHGDRPDEYRDDLEALLGLITGRRAWIVSEIASVLDCFEPEILEALSVAITLIPEHTTVEYWTRELGLRRRQRLWELFARHELPGPKRVLEWLRLARVVDHAATRSRVSRDDLARTFRYSSGNYLGRRAKQLAGQPLGQLVAGGVTWLLAQLSSRD